MLAKAKVLIASALADQMLPTTRGAAPWELFAWLDASRAGSPDIARPSQEWVGKVRQGLDASSRDDSSAPDCPEICSFFPLPPSPCPFK